MTLTIEITPEVQKRIESIAETKIHGGRIENVASKLLGAVFEVGLEEVFLKRKVDGFVQEFTRDILNSHIQHKTTTYEDPWELAIYHKPEGYATTPISIPLKKGVYVTEVNGRRTCLSFYPECLWGEGLL